MGYRFAGDLPGCARLSKIATLFRQALVCADQNRHEFYETTAIKKRDGGPPIVFYVRLLKDGNELRVEYGQELVHIPAATVERRHRLRVATHKRWGVINLIKTVR